MKLGTITANGNTWEATTLDRHSIRRSLLATAQTSRNGDNALRTGDAAFEDFAAVHHTTGDGQDVGCERANAVEFV